MVRIFPTHGLAQAHTRARHIPQLTTTAWLQSERESLSVYLRGYAQREGQEFKTKF